MIARHCLAVSLLAVACASPAWAQPAPPAAPAPAASSATPKAQAPARPHVVIIEDDGVRIEETRSGGKLQRIVVQSKVGGVRSYEIQVAPAGRDPAQERGNAGQRAWLMLSF